MTTGELPQLHTRPRTGLESATTVHVGHGAQHRDLDSAAERDSIALHCMGC
ncbi:hypothetical protein [Mycobacterium angelicum]|uniref:hypothetical protein n=1 Tax=Mycobacterium angelicum TaxID=470074 RepID=UPI00147636DF|nr:hypothetical protein [Mycobacterium angelicum]MCV7199508.1 hypothetical protein [Mycobacterium angelicum]